MDTLKLQCAWCRAVIRDGKMPVSHGCCRTCGNTLLALLSKEDK